MELKIFKRVGNNHTYDGWLFDEDINVHTANVYLSAKSIYYNNVLYSVVDSVLDINNNRIEIIVELR